jgi:hypothetical protein
LLFILTSAVGLSYLQNLNNSLAWERWIDFAGRSISNSGDANSPRRLTSTAPPATHYGRRSAPTQALHYCASCQGRPRVYEERMKAAGSEVQFMKRCFLECSLVWFATEHRAAEVQSAAVEATLGRTLSLAPTQCILTFLPCLTARENGRCSGPQSAHPSKNHAKAKPRVRRSCQSRPVSTHPWPAESPIAVPIPGSSLAIESPPFGEFTS